MSDAEALFRAGDLARCLEALQAQVRRSPADPKPRVFLAQVLMVLGQWDRAVTQLKVVAEMDSQALPMAHAYGAAIQCERLREAVFAGQRSPLVFGDPEGWIALLLQSLALLAGGRAAEADRLRVQAFDAAPAASGSLNGESFEWIADADSRLGPVLELFLNGAYYWVPFHRLQRLTIDPPADVRDLVWLPAQLTWNNGGEAVGFVPTRYAGSERAQDSALQLARRTEWSAVGEDAYAGTGQRILATSAAEVALLDVRELVLAPPQT